MKDTIYAVIVVFVLFIIIWYFGFRTDQNDPVAEITTQCTIKGNINSKGDKIYHTANCLSYEKTQIDESMGEKWFCNEQQAREAGWRKATNCPPREI